MSLLGSPSMLNEIDQILMSELAALVAPERRVAKLMLRTLARLILQVLGALVF